MAMINIQTSSNTYITPPSMVQPLLRICSSPSEPCHCHKCSQSSQASISEVQQSISALQAQISNIAHETRQAEELLARRDALYAQMDQLRGERQRIEGAIMDMEEKLVITKSSGYREMNERLRRRIMEIRQYVQKMNLENQKIEQNLIITTQMHTTYAESMLNGGMNYIPNSMSNHTFSHSLLPPKNTVSPKSPSIDMMLTRLREKQEQAWNRVRRQQEQIQRRNASVKSRVHQGLMMGRSEGRWRAAQRDRNVHREYYSPQIGRY